jgi:hypothetical protein
MLLTAAVLTLLGLLAYLPPAASRSDRSAVAMSRTVRRQSARIAAVIWSPPCLRRA